MVVCGSTRARLTNARSWWERVAKRAFLLFRFRSLGRFLIQLSNSFKLLRVAARLVQEHASVVVYVDPEIRLSITVGKVACFVECFAVFPERSAWRCEGVDWIQSYNAILPLRCLSLHLFTSGGAFSSYRNVASKASNKNLSQSFLSERLWDPTNPSYAVDWRNGNLYAVMCCEAESGVDGTEDKPSHSKGGV